MAHRSMACVLATAFVLACNGETDDDGAGGSAGAGGGAPEWQVVHEGLDGALLSVWGTSATDVWAVGADTRDGSGPQVLHFDGSAWERVETGQTEGDLWWVFGLDGGPLYMGGAGGVILRHDGDAFTLLATPTTDTVFGIWGTSEDDMWAVGGTADANGFAWRLVGDVWEPEATLPAELVADAAIWKVFGTSADEVWLVGSNGVSLSWDGQTLAQGDAGVGSSLFTVHANARRYAAVGGLASGVIVENDGSGWQNALGGSASYGLAGVVLDDADGGVAVGQYGLVVERTSDGWTEIDTGLDVQRDLHGVWLDSSGGVWAVGGQTASFPLTDGLMIHRGDAVSSAGL